MLEKLFAGQKVESCLSACIGFVGTYIMGATGKIGYMDAPLIESFLFKPQIPEFQEMVTVEPLISGHHRRKGLVSAN